jgi:hypothetical protein
MMAPSVEDVTQDLAQFEPDPDGQGSSEGATVAAAPGEPDDPQWIVWPDAEGESAWAAAELDQIGATWHI